MIDEAQVFSRALSGCEIRALHAARTAGHCVGDVDGDLLPDFEDNCPQVSNAAQVDTDADGVGDACDCAPGDPGVHSTEETREPAFTEMDVLDRCRDSSVTGPDSVYDVIRGDLTDLPVATSSAACRSRCAAPATGLVGWWSGDGDASDLVGGHDGALENGAGYADGVTLQAFAFDGVNDRVRTGNIALGSTFTVAAWVNPSKAVQGAHRRIVETSFSTHFALTTDNPGSRYKFIVRSPSSPYGAVQGGRVVPGAWQFVVGTYDGTTGTLYVDGDAVASGAFTAPDPVSLPVNIGAYFGGGFSWAGTIDEVQIYDRPLSSSEVWALYEAGSAGTCKAGVGGLDVPSDEPWVADDDVPAPGRGFWYLYRARNACGDVSYGFATDGSERSSATCDGGGRPQGPRAPSYPRRSGARPRA